MRGEKIGLEENVFDQFKLTLLGKTTLDFHYRFFSWAFKRLYFGGKLFEKTSRILGIV